MANHSLDDLLRLMARLREPEYGCPWDLKQSYRSITPSTIEEVYEVVDAIEREDYDHLKEELGDLLFQIVFYGQLAKEENRFKFDDIVDAITTKLLRRHPHVFPEGTLDSRRDLSVELSDDTIKANWEAIKKSERGEKGKHGVLDDVPRTLPSLTRAFKLQKRASHAGFDWPHAGPVIDKLHEEITELKEAVAMGDQRHIEEELGDILFTSVNLARHLKVEPDQSLRFANQKFERRFRYIESQIASESQSINDLSEAELEALWLQAKKAGL